MRASSSTVGGRLAGSDGVLVPVMRALPSFAKLRIRSRFGAPPVAGHRFRPDPPYCQDDFRDILRAADASVIWYVSRGMVHVASVAEDSGA